MMVLLLSVPLTLPWGELPSDPPAEVSPKKHTVAWYTSGFE